MGSGADDRRARTNRMDETTERDLRELLDRDRVVALMNRYLATVDERSDFDTEWARSLFSDDVRVEHRGIVLEGLDAIAADAVRTPDGWRFHGFEQRIVWSSGQSHVDIAASGT
jgi:SnoaL-like domain